MLTGEQRRELEKQQYRLVGSHSAVKICGWTKSMIQGKGGCYKLKFYGIMSNQCMQMTCSFSCPNRCIICWRGYKAPVAEKWEWEADEPDSIIDGCMKAHHQLLVGFAGSESADMDAYEKSKQVKHMAISLTGESIMYPKINEMIAECGKQGISTFLVSKGQYPEEIRKLRPVSQLYLSLDGPTRELVEEIDKPVFKDHWERLEKSLDELAKKNQRTCIRVTLIKGVNMVKPEGWAKLILKGDPDFIEVKAYMFLGASRKRLKEENMPLHPEVKKFTKRLASHLPGWEIVSEHVPSRVVLLAKKKFKINEEWHIWIDFDKWNEINASGPDAMDYIKKTPDKALTDESCEEMGLWE
ncbi:MAG: 4-demethylwyosine synthase TYW1 [Nanoarchaeota archaeon]|nr:4-demethylwyosine synthase TYW1 [Nanoarchaeota archaeon]